MISLFFDNFILVSGFPHSRLLLPPSTLPSFPPCKSESSFPRSFPVWWLVLTGIILWPRFETNHWSLTGSPWAPQPKIIQDLGNHWSLAGSPWATQPKIIQDLGSQLFSREEQSLTLLPICDWLPVGTALCRPNAGSHSCCETLSSLYSLSSYLQSLHSLCSVLCDVPWTSEGRTNDLFEQSWVICLHCNSL